MRNRESCDEHAVLVVDDDEAIRWLLCEALSSEGYEVRVAANGKEALSLLSGDFRPCLILLDLNMPVMNGWQFCAEQYRRPELASLPVAIMSAAQNLAIEQPPCVPTAVVPKPFDLDHVIHLVGTVAGAHQR
jgi:CheY-like chemotaxis protein